MAEARDGSLLAGRVGRPHGLDGSFYVTGAQAPLLVQGGALTLGGSPTEIVRRAGTDERPIVRVTLASDRDAAAALRGAELRVQAAAAPELGPDEYWPEQLEGSRVVDAGREVGVVKSMLTLPSCECLEVAREDAPVLLVPLVHDAIRSIDVEHKLIEVDLAFLGEAS